MKLIKITINNYRSIIKAYNLDISNLTILVGPNNEGKSNILKAINLALDILSNWNKKRQIMTRYYRVSSFRNVDRIDYNWTRDFPINLQNEHPEGKSTITLELQLTKDELIEFQNKTNINLNTNLKIKMGFGQKDVSYDILMKGRAKKSLNSKRNEISEFIQGKLVYQYISAIRPSSYAKNIIERVLDTELEKLEENTEYQKAIKKIEEIQQPVLLKLSTKISQTIKTFIPSVKNVSISQKDTYRRYMKRDCEVFIDDGTNTELSMKGDGIVSLSSISLVQHFNNELAKSKNLIFAIEEPESHLHPDSINALKEVLLSIAEKSQVIISTHSPILVDRLVIDNNIIVTCGKAIKPKTIKEIREILGIRLSDNLVNAQIVLLVEGNSDKLILLSLLPKSSTKIKGALEKGLLIIDAIGGASKLSYYSQFYKQNLTNLHIYFDNDDEARTSVNSSISKSLIKDDEYTLINCPGMPNSEIEDIFNLDSHKDVILNEFSVNIDVAKFNTNKKWSDKVKQIFLDNGKMWDDRIEEKVKTKVAQNVRDIGLSSLNRNKKISFGALVRSLENKIAKIK